MVVMIQKEHVRVQRSVEDWKQAVIDVVNPLVEDGYVEKRYIDGIFENTEKLGPYYVIAPDIALPHARPEQGVIQKAMSVLLLKEPIRFSEDGHDVRLLIALAATDSQSHLESLVTLSQLLSDEDLLAKILQASSNEELYEFFKDL